MHGLGGDQYIHPEQSPDRLDVVGVGEFLSQMFEVSQVNV